MAVMSRTGVLGVFLVWVITVVWSRPTGAPTSACVSMLPVHGASGQAVDTSPFTVTAYTVDFTTEQDITVAVSGSVHFQGVLLQARVVNTDTPVGYFSDIPNGIQTLNCSNANDAITHSNTNGKSSVTVKWTAPSNSIGNIEFVATVAYTKQIFWTQIRSTVITALPDVCASAPCLNGGTCYKTSNKRSYFCGCPEPSQMGPNCELLNQCTPNPCLNGGVCFRSAASTTNFACQCSLGHFSGQRCEIVIALCEPNPCLSGGLCQEANNAVTCFCPSDRHGPRCEYEVTTCNPDPCLNGATCLESPTGHECICAFGWSGDNCTTSLFCESDSCLNNGICFDSNPPGSQIFYCQCGIYYTGIRCETAVNPCQPSPCMNGGTCFRDTNGFTVCQCLSDYIGDTCEVRVHPCVMPVTPCQNGGLCYQGAGYSYACECPTGYSGDDCEILGACFSVVCQNGGTCVPQDDQLTYTCQCAPSHDGQYCQYANNCELDDPCLGGSPCRYIGQGFIQCDCPDGLAGRYCEIDVSCNPSPCQNGGTCTPAGGGNYRCDCLAVYSGTNCQDYTDPCTAERNPCVNGNCRIVLDPVRSLTCDCDDNYDGENCTTYIGNDACATFPCHNAATCTSGSGDEYVCTCATEFFGTNCQNRGACFSVVCQNGGTCVPQDDQLTYTCQCAPSHDGQYCQYANNCELDDPCLDGSHCRYIGQGFIQCDCPDGLAGRYCELDVSCNSSPCRNGGTCTPRGGGNYRCNCQAVYSGSNCQNYTDPCTAERNPCVNGECRIVLDPVRSLTCDCDDKYDGENCTTYIGNACDVFECFNDGECISSATDGPTCVCGPDFSGAQCKRKINPTLTGCPSGLTISFPLGEGSDGAYIDLLFTARDQNDTLITVTVTDGLEFPNTVRFTEEYREGKEITVRAEDIEGKSSMCLFRLRIFDDESPSVQCPPDVSAITAQSSVAVSFPLATATDNLGITEPLQYTPSNGSQFAPGPNTVLVKALDTFDNQGECSFKVVVLKKESDCTTSTAPDNGVSTCVVDGERKTCSVECNEGFGSAVDLSEYMCVYKNPAYWEPRPNADICVPFKPGFSASKVVSLRFSIDSALCNTLNFDVSVVNSLTESLQSLGICAANDATMSCHFELECGNGGGGGRRRRANADLNVDVGIAGLAGEEDTTSDVETRLGEAVDSVKAGAATASLSVQIEGETITNEPTAFRESNTVWDCKPGQVSRPNGCLSCPPGTYHDATSNECTYCQVHTYQNKAEQKSCMPCPEGSETQQTGAFSKDHCQKVGEGPLAGPWTPTIIGIVGGAGGLIVLLLVILACVFIVKCSRRPSHKSRGDSKDGSLSNFSHLNKAYDETEETPDMQFHGDAFPLDGDDTYQNIGPDGEHTPTGSTDHLVRIPSLSQYSDYYATLNARSAPNLEPVTPPPPPPVAAPTPPAPQMNGGPPVAPPAPPVATLNTNNSNTSTEHAYLNGSVVNGGSRAKFQV